MSSTPTTPASPSSGGRPGPVAPSRRSGRARLALLLALVALPLLELFVVIQVGRAIGAGWTILLLLGTSLLGGWVVRREGARAWRSLREAVDAGRTPTTELADGALVLAGGAMLVGPGFVTDVLGALLILPLTRPLFRRLLALVVARRLVVLSAGVRAAQAHRSPGAGPVVPGEVVDEDRPPSDGRPEGT